MIPELTMYRIGFYVMAITTVAFLAWISRKPAGTRRYYLPIPIICGTLSLAYFGMSIELLRLTTPDGQPVPLSRYADYFVTAPLMILVAGLVAGATRRQLAALVLLVVGWISATLAGFFLTEPASLAANVLTFGLLGLIVYALLWPITKRSGTTSGERVLLYGKLRNLLLLLWVSYLVLGLITRQGLGLLDAFGGIFVGAYLDIATRIGFGLLVLRADDAMAHLIGDIESGGGSDDEGDEVTFTEPSDAGGEADPDVEPAD